MGIGNEMLQALIYTYKLRQLQKGKRRLASRYAKLIAAEKTPDGKYRLTHEEFNEATEYDDEIHQLQYEYLMREAETHLVPTPEFDNKSDGWEQSRLTGRWRLSPTEQARLRSAVRAEKDEIRFKWATSLISVLSLIVAILALCLKK